MKLTSLNPRWVDKGGEGITKITGEPVPYQRGAGIIFQCPKCGQELYLEFSNPLDGSVHTGTETELWNRAGDSFDFLTLSPSVVHDNPETITIMHQPRCGWHGWIKNGAIINA